VVFPLLLPVVVAGALGMAAACAVGAVEARPGWGLPPLGVIALWVLILAAHALAGFALSRVLPVLLAVPLAMVASFLVTSYPKAMEPLWLRHLTTGGTDVCCAIDQTPDWRPALSAALVSVGVVAAGLVALSLAWSRRTRLTAASGLTVAALLAGGYVAYGLPAEPITYRSGSDLRCTGTAPTVCVWPELASKADDIHSWAAQADQRLTGAGLSLPGTFTTQAHAPANQLSMGTWDRPNHDVVTLGVAGSLVPASPPSCATRGPFPGGEAYGTVTAWLALSAGMRPVALHGRYDPKDIAAAQLVRAEPRNKQLAWYRHNSLALRDCTTIPQPPIASVAQQP
jgi:hypothetical protein